MFSHILVERLHLAVVNITTHILLTKKNAKAGHDSKGEINPRESQHPTTWQKEQTCSIWLKVLMNFIKGDYENNIVIFNISHIGKMCTEVIRVVIATL